MVVNVEIVNVKIDSVTVPKGRRPASQQVAAMLADSIREVGLLNPITVTSDRVLVAGLHRIEAHRLLGRDTIPAHVMTLDQLDRELAAIDENRIRNNLSVLEES
jgi:ParB-like chromosome segregation protein Spo0J